MTQTLYPDSKVPAEVLEPLTQVVTLLGETFADRLTERIGGVLPDFDAQQKQTGYALETIRNQLNQTATQSELLEQVNQTNQTLGERFYDQRIIQPMARGLFPVMDVLDQAIARDDTDDVLVALRVQLQQFLAQYGIQVIRHEIGSEFDPAVMKPLQTTATGDPSLDGSVADSLQCGFRISDHILRWETVGLYRFEIPEKSSDDEDSES